MKRLETFSHNSETLRVIFQQSVEVTPEVTCDVYIHPETNERDLGIITIQPGKRTPLQRVFGGDETIEGYISGNGVLTIIHADGSVSEFPVGSGSEGFSQVVEVGEIMQWRASDNGELVVFEICFPPYADGRFENLLDSSKLHALADLLDVLEQRLRTDDCGLPYVQLIIHYLREDELEKARAVALREGDKLGDVPEIKRIIIDQLFLGTVDESMIPKSFPE